MADEKEKFRAHKPEEARLLARKAKELFKKTSHVVGLGESRCRICNHPQREEIDYLVLIGAPLRAMQEAMGVQEKNWTRGQFQNHRDNHLVPLIMTEVVPSLSNLIMLPHPREGGVRDRAEWYFIQAYGIYLELANQGKGMQALTALQHMRDIDFEYLAIPVEKQAQPTEETLPVVSDGPIELRNRDKMLKAIELSAVRRVKVDEADA